MQGKSQEALLNVTPYKHQAEAIDFALRTMGYCREPPKSKSCAVLAEMGTGKTVITLGIAGTLYSDGHISKMLVVAPLSILGVWKKEFAKFAKYQFTLEVLEGSRDKKLKTLERLENSHHALQVAVINYESAVSIEAELAEWQPDLIVCDESSKIKGQNAKRSKVMHRLGKVSKHNIILTGTPITNSPLEFFSQYKFLDESIFGKSYFVFQARYAIMGGYGMHQIIGYKNLDDLTSKAHAIAYRITKAEALDLPEQVDSTMPLVLEPRAESVYRRVERESVAELESGEVTAPNVLTKLLRLSQITGGHLKSDDGERVEEISRAKMDALENIIGECLEAGKKLVVFARFIPEIDAIAKMLRKTGTGYALIKGDVKDRQAEVDKFQDDPECKVFVGQLQATSMGLTLTAADTAVFYSLSYNYADYEQAKARIHRIGQKNHCTYIHLVVDGTVDEKVMEALKSKKNMTDLVVDNWRSLFKNGGTTN